MVHQEIRPANGFVCGSFFCVMCDGKACAWCTIPYGAGSCYAAMRLAFASRGPVAKNSALHCFLNAPADGAPKKASDLRIGGSFLACTMDENRAPARRRQPTPQCGVG